MDKKFLGGELNRALSPHPARLSCPHLCLLVTLVRSTLVCNARPLDAGQRRSTAPNHGVQAGARRAGVGGGRGARVAGGRAATVTGARPTQNPKIFQDSPSHRIFRYMHKLLNIDKNKN